MNSVKLINNNGYSWYFKTNSLGQKVWVKGFLLINDTVLSETDFLDYISDCNGNELPKLIADFDGFFSIVVEDGNSIFAAVDHMRSFPILYKETNCGICVFDMPTMDDYESNTVNPKNENIFLSTTFTLENTTLFDNYFQIPAGKYLLVNDSECRLERYWEPTYNKNQVSNIKEAKELILNAYEHLFNMCAKIIGNRKVVISLSGGYDSRLVLNGLLKAGIDRNNIITYTCGIKKYDDSRISKLVADAVNIKNYYINYDSKRARKYFKNNFKKYSFYASNLVSSPSIQEWYAISELIRKENIDKDSIFVTGYGGILPGHYITPQIMNADREEIKGILTNLMNEFADYKPRQTHQEKKNIIDCIWNTEYFSSLNKNSSCIEFVECYEKFIYLEEQSKHIQNSVRNHEFYGFKWLTPLFLKEQFELWGRIANPLRVGNNTFLDAMKEFFLPELLEIEFTGSKVAKKKTKNKGKFGKLAEFLFQRKKLNYIYSMFPYLFYYRVFFKNMYITINYAIAYKYLRLLKKIKGKKL